MFSGRTTPEGIIALVMEEIDRLGGLAKAFPNDGQIQLYSGPYKKYELLAVGLKKGNDKRALKQIKEAGWKAKRLRAFRIAAAVMSSTAPPTTSPPARAPRLAGTVPKRPTP